MNGLLEKGAGNPTPVKKSLPSYWSGLGWIISGVVMEIIGRVFAASVVESTRGMSMRDALSILNQVANIRGFTDLILVVLVAVGIIQLVRTYRVRAEQKK